MAPDSSLSRRQLLAAGGAAGALLGGGRLARRYLRTAAGAPTTAGGPSAWPMAARDSGGTAYAPEADSPADGVRVRWSHPLPLGPDHHPSPVVSNGVVYAVGDSYALALSAADGERVARFDRTSTGAPTVAPGRAYRSQTAAVLEPASFDPHTLVGYHGRGRDAVGDVTAGATRWTVGVGEPRASYSQIRFGGSGVPPSVAAGDRLLGVFRGTLTAVDASSGTVAWTSDDSITGVRPAVRNGSAYVVDAEGAVRAYDVATGDRREGSASSEDGDRAMYLVAGPERLFVAGPGWLRADAWDRSTTWRVPFPGEAAVPAGPMAVADGTVYARRPGSTEPRLCALDASDGSIRWTCPDLVPSEDTFLPAATDESVYVPTDEGELAAVDAADGSVRWRFDPGGERCSPAALAGDAVYVLANGNLYALEEP